MKEVPLEVQVARKAYNAEYDKIRPLLRANRNKYLGTKFENCPPLIKEQGQFLISNKALKATKDRLREAYGECPLMWSMWVTWYEKKRLQKEDNS